MMKRASLFVLVALVLCFALSAPQAAPRLVMPETTFDFGFVPQNSKITHVYWLYSKGDDSLQILKVIPGCGCTQAPLEKSGLSAGDSTRLEVIFDTKHFTDQITKRPRIETNEGPPEKYVEFSCDVLRRPDSTYPIIIKPYKIDLSQFGEKTRDQMKVTITNVSDKPLDIKIVAAPAELFTAAFPKTVGPGMSADGTVKLSAGAVKKEFEKSITLQLSDDKSTRFTIPVKRSLRMPGDTTQAASVQQVKTIETK